jgi:phage terminase Nu1 subunit (DNA packaging protein)
MKNVSVNELANLTGKQWRTVKSRLDAAGLTAVAHSRNATLYASADALEAIYAVSGAAGELHLDEERARLAKEQADKLAIENALTRGEIMYTTDMAEAMGVCYEAARAKLRAAGSKLGVILDPTNPKRARDLIDREHNEVLTELADLDVAAAMGERAPDDDAPDVVDAEVNGNGFSRRRRKAPKRQNRSTNR